MSDRPPSSASQGGQRYRTPNPGRAKASGSRSLSPQRQSRLVGRTVPLLILSIGSFAVGIAVGATDSVSGGAQRFAEAWERQDFAAMHAELTAAAKEAYPLAELESTYTEAQATATAAELDAGEVSQEGDVASFRATIETHAFGEVTGDVELALDGEGAVEWEPHFAFPGLEEGEELSRETSVGERAPLLAANGTPLAEGPATARSSPLGDAATSIAGSVSDPDRAEDDEQYALGFPQGTPTGTSGLELAFNARLAGQPSGTLFARGPEGERVLASGEPKPGEPVKTTIDPEVQSAAVTALGAQYGGVAVIDAGSGDVRGMAGLAYSAPQPPGSTFKIVTAVAGLDAGAVTLEDEFPVETSNSEIGREISNAHDAACGGTFVRSFADSCNTVFAPLGVEVGVEKMIETAEAFGFESVPSLAADEPLEALAPPPPSLGEIESDVALGEASIGQGQVLATPLTMASIAQTIASDGIRMPTSIVKTPDLRPGAEPVKVTSKETADMVERMMLEVVRSGTGTAAQIPGIEVAGKTGTAELGPAPLEPGQVLAPGEDPPQKENAWFASYAPAGKPQLALAVMLVDATGGGGGVAAPIARDIYASVLED